ncbi:MAG: hypothetical protein ACREAE_06175 [Nitrosopumilaceae archaeon]
MAGNIRKRRENVSSCLVRGMTETRIADEIGVSRQTVVRDVAYLKKHSQNWFDGLAKDGFIFEYKLALEKLKDVDSELEKLYGKAKGVSEKVSILKTRKENAKTYLELLSETPTVHALRKVMGRKDV